MRYLRILCLYAQLAWIHFKGWLFRQRWFRWLNLYWLYAYRRSLWTFRIVCFLCRGYSPRQAVYFTNRLFEADHRRRCRDMQLQIDDILESVNSWDDSMMDPKEREHMRESLNKLREHIHDS